ncbi:MAG: hypothetical protein A2285_10450 [Elusimicrobia bacterium RIFOXYA12_FULL_57_11]|nr:MAG: hypothetical protein A2285_10450 [Elusimicrobia bacterium RIFOXYA12_FULL_57_11]
MKYWFYSEGNILGPYDPAEMLAMPAFSDESLVCAETATGDNADDWKSASQVAEIASMMGAGRAVTASVAAGAYRLESALNVSGFEDKDIQAGASYSDLLDTIDNILGTRKEDQDPARAQPADYELAEKFDIRLSRIQEELEAARWEKNLLLEKMRMKEMEEKKNRARISELEARLKGEFRSAEMNARELDQVRHLTDITERSETIKKIEEIRREEQSLEKYLVPEREGGVPDIPPEAAGKDKFEAETKTLKTISPSAPIGLQRLSGTGTDEAPQGTGVTGHKLKSLGQTQPPAYVYGAKPEAAGPAAVPAPEPLPMVPDYNSYRSTPLPGPEAAPSGAYKPSPEFEPLPQQEAGLVYDFTVVTSKPAGTSQQFKIEARSEPAAVPVPAPAPVHTPVPVPVMAAPAQPLADEQPVQPVEFVPASPVSPVFQQPQVFSPSLNQAPQGQFSSFSPSSPSDLDHKPAVSGTEERALPGAEDKIRRVSPEPETGSPDKTIRTVLPDPKGKPPAAAPSRQGKKGGKAAFVSVVLIFGCIAAGGLGYFFLGDGVSFSEFSMLNFGGGNKTGVVAAQPESAVTTAGIDAQVPAAGVQTPPAGEAQPQVSREPQEPQAPQVTEKPSENIRKALEIVKTYKLAGGRGSVESWLANSFLSGGAGGANEEWTATPLHGDILVVQYRLLRPKQDPMMYQFEVDAAKGTIVRGINNNAIDLLDASREKTVSAAPVRKPVKQQPRVKKPAKPRELSILPLPDEPAAGGQVDADPTGFEQPENDDKVKYLKAQESDEELF